MEEKTVYALGFFDGVHRGHGALLAACRRLAEETGRKAGVVTFTTHPDTLVFGEAPALICTNRERERILKSEFHMDTVLALPFDDALRAMPWQDFLTLLVERYGAAGFVCGADFTFGSRGAGSAGLLREACRRRGIPCAVVPQMKLDGQVISSTLIRRLVEAGQMERATEFLGHPYYLTGQVIHGRRLGSTLGFPTANLEFPQGLAVPKFGVYACRAIVDGAGYPAVTNVGTRPTVDGEHLRVESWILDFEGNLYDREIRLDFYCFLRPETKFPDTEVLRREIMKDAGETRAYFRAREEKEGA